MRRTERNSKKIKKFSKKKFDQNKFTSKKKYKKINNSTRRKLIELIINKNVQLKEASKLLCINYSTAKTILRIYRLEKRIEKKSVTEENKLRELIGDNSEKASAKCLHNYTEGKFIN